MRLSFLILFLLLTNVVSAPDLHFIDIIDSKPVDLYDRLMNAVIYVESRGDTLAYNPFEKAYGPMQIRPIRLLDYNIRTGKNYAMRDCFRTAVSKEIFLYYAERIGYPKYETIARSWNGSGKMTIEYWKKVKTRLESN